MAREEMAADTAHVRRLSRRLVEGIRAQLEHVVFNGDEANTYDGCVNLSFAYVEVSLSKYPFIYSSLRLPAASLTRLRRLVAGRQKMRV